MSVMETTRSTKQEGMVSILVTMLLLIIVSLLVLGFASVARRNQRQSLDRQLSTQAFYAAETGINDVRNLIHNNLITGTAVPAKTDCNPASVAAYAPPNLDPNVDAANDIAYSCIMVDPSPDVLSYDDIGTNSTVIPLIASSGTIGRLILNWQSKDGTGTPLSSCPASASGVFKPTSTWTCGYGVLRFDLVPTSGSLTQAGLQASTMTSFIVPFSSGGTSTYGYVTNVTSANNIIKGSCTNSGCTLTITVPSSTQYYLRVSSIYKDAALQVRIADASGNPLETSGTQAVIDATGRAQDVLRRVQVHVPLSAVGVTAKPDYAIASTDAICKRFVTMTGFFQSYAAAAVSGLTSITTPANPLCQ